MPVRPGDRRGLDGAQAARGRGGGADDGGAEVDGADLRDPGAPAEGLH
ncbi:MAG: hypothetical protein ACLPUO_06140 [Streptosporangiaceae bacterium]